MLRHGGEDFCVPIFRQCLSLSSQQNAARRGLLLPSHCSGLQPLTHICEFYRDCKSLTLSRLYNFYFYKFYFLPATTFNRPGVKRLIRYKANNSTDTSNISAKVYTISNDESQFGEITFCKIVFIGPNRIECDI